MSFTSSQSAMGLPHRRSRVTYWKSCAVGSMCLSKRTALPPARQLAILAVSQDDHISCRHWHLWQSADALTPARQLHWHAPSCCPPLALCVQRSVDTVARASAALRVSSMSRAEAGAVQNRHPGRLTSGEGPNPQGQQQAGEQACRALALVLPVGLQDGLRLLHQGGAQGGAHGLPCQGGRVEAGRQQAFLVVRVQPAMDILLTPSDGGWRWHAWHAWAADEGTSAQV